MSILLDGRLPPWTCWADLAESCRPQSFTVPECDGQDWDVETAMEIGAFRQQKRDFRKQKCWVQPTKPTFDAQKWGVNQLKRAAGRAKSGYEQPTWASLSDVGDSEDWSDVIPAVGEKNHSKG